MQLKRTFCLSCLAALSIFAGLAGLSGCDKSKEDNRVVITLPSAGGDRVQKMYEELIPAFEKANPNIKVKRLDIPGKSFYIKLQVMIAGGCAPDLIPMMTMRLPMFLHRHAFRPLDDLMAADADFQARKADIYEKTFQGFQKDGKTYGMAYSQNLYGMYFNKTIFDKYNAEHPGNPIEYPNGTWTLEKFIAVAKKLTAGEGANKVYGTITNNTPFYVICPILRRFGVELFDEGATRCNLDKPEAIEAMRYYFNWGLDDGIAPSPKGVGGRGEGAVAGGPEEMFMSGRVAMWEAESEWRFEFNDKIKNFEWDVAEPPQGRNKACGFECFGMTISATSKHPAEAWKFISYLLSPEGQRILSKHRIGIPVLRSLCNSPDCFLNPQDPPAHKEAFLKTLEYGQDIPSLRNFQEVESAISEELELGRIGDKDIADACRAAAAAANKLLKENAEDN